MENVKLMNEDKVDQDCIRKESDEDDNQVKLATNIITGMEKCLSNRGVHWNRHGHVQI